MTNPVIDIQLACEESDIPSTAQLTQWASMALGKRDTQTEITLRLVDATESQQLNHTYRQKNYPTNVLSFPFEAPATIPCNTLGDVVICASVVSAEAAAQHKHPEAHWAHMVIHGCLHLLGYDHIEQHDADKMEAQEIALLSELGYPNPYKAHTT